MDQAMTSRSDAIATLERRLGHLEQRIAAKMDRGDWRGLTFDRSEVGAIRLALKDLRRQESVGSESA